MSAASDHYANLGIPKTATVAEVRQAYKSKAIATHPDKNESTKDATVAFQKVVEAYECLFDSSKRATYDINHKPSTSSTSNNKPSNSGFQNFSDTCSRSSHPQTNSIQSVRISCYRNVLIQVYHNNSICYTMEIVAPHNNNISINVDKIHSIYNVGEWTIVTGSVNII
ncbi:hypothetical protein ABW20_dc0101532 [Dactylellina cionopaga]|nr:hypothetical protein ABW20_dc0101532 [Dactylellina cionopaga]